MDTPWILMVCILPLLPVFPAKPSAGPLEEWQKRTLEKIQLFAREGGLPEEDWKNITEYDKQVCYEKACLASALEIMLATNFTQDPCKQWLGFVCARRVNGPDNINQFARLQKVVEYQTRKLLEEDPDKLKQNFLLKEAQTYYFQCANKKLNDEKDVRDILEFLTKSYGEWPVLANTDPGKKFDWFRMLADLNRIERVGFEPLLLQVDFPSSLTDDSDTNMKLKLGQLSFSLTPEDFVTMMRRIQQHSGKRKPVRLDQLGRMFRFLNEAKDASLMSAMEVTMTIERLQQMTSAYFKKSNITNLDIHWLKFFQTVMKGTKLNVTETQPLVDVSFVQVMGVLKAVSDTFKVNDSRSVSNALNFQLASLLLQESTGILDDLNSIKCKEQTGTTAKICYARTIEIFGYSLGKSYLSVYYNYKRNIPGISELMLKIQQGYLQLIGNIGWMEDSTKEHLRDKVKSMSYTIAEPEWVKDPSKLQEFYETLTASDSRNSSYPLNYLNVTSWGTAKKRAWALKFSELVHDRRWSEVDIWDISWSRYLGEVQAAFALPLNQARIEGGIVQPPIFGVGRPGYMNYGGLGSILAHEVGHSYDTKGRRYNKHGDFGEFWDKESVKRYLEWVRSILADYSRAIYQTSDTTQESFNSTKTIDEDIADALGIYISYLAYKEYLKELKIEGKSEKILPGLKNYSSEKLFYMKYGNMWCEKRDINDHFTELLIGDHSSGNTRAVLPLLRSREFAKTFGCKIPKQYVGSDRNKSDKRSI